MDIQFNMNDNVEVTLTKFGAEVYNNYYAALKAEHSWVEVEPKQEGEVLKEQLWSLMQMYGEHIHLGMVKVPFKGNIMTLVGK